MAIINQKFVHFRTKAKFDEHLAAGDILDSSIVFIQNRKLIWTQGKFYGEGNYLIFDTIEARDAFESKDGQLCTITAEDPHKLYVYNGTEWVDTSLPENVVLYNDVNDVELRRNLILPKEGKLLGTEITGVQYELIGLGDYPQTGFGNLEETELGTDLRGRTIKFDTTKIPVKLEEGNEGIIVTGDQYWAMHVEVYESAIILYCNGEAVYNNGWLMSEYTYPDTEAIIVYYPPMTRLDINNGFNPTTDVTISRELTLCQTEVGSEHVHLNLNTNNKVTVETPEGKGTVAVYNKEHELWTEGPIVMPKNSGIAITHEYSSGLNFPIPILMAGVEEFNRNLDQLPVGEDLGNRRHVLIKTSKPIIANTLSGRLIYGDVTVDDQDNTSGTIGGYLRINSEGQLVVTEHYKSYGGGYTKSTYVLWDGTKWLEDNIWFVLNGYWSNILITENTLSATPEAVFNWGDFTENVTKIVLGYPDYNLTVHSTLQPKWHYLDGQTETIKTFAMVEDIPEVGGIRLEMDLSNQITGTNNTFELGKEVKYPALYYNGLRQSYGKHYGITGTSLILNFITEELPKVGEDLILEYSE